MARWRGARFWRASAWAWPMPHRRNVQRGSGDRSRRRRRPPKSPRTTRARELLGAGGQRLAGGGRCRRRRARRSTRRSRRRTLTGLALGEAHLDRARALVAAGDAGGARADLDRALADAPADPLAWLLSATLARRMRRPRRAHGPISPRRSSSSADDASVQLEAGNIAALAATRRARAPGGTARSQLAPRRPRRGHPHAPRWRSSPHRLENSSAQRGAISRPAMKYLHTMIRVTDPDATIAFFELLGLKEVRRIDNEKGRFTLIFLAAPGHEAPASARGEVELTYNWDPRGAYTGGRNFGHLAYRVDDIYDDVPAADGRRRTRSTARRATATWRSSAPPTASRSSCCRTAGSSPPSRGRRCPIPAAGDGRGWRCEVVRVPALSDNYVWLIHDATRRRTDGRRRSGRGGAGARCRRGQGLARPMRSGYTHWHPDHTGGIAEIKARVGSTVTGPAAEAAKIPTLDRGVGGGRHGGDRRARRAVIETPGHTAGHIVFSLRRRRAALQRRHAVRDGLRPAVRGRRPTQMFANMQRLARSAGRDDRLRRA